MANIFIHLSDIHFGQEKGGVVKVHDDVKEEIIIDVRKMTSAFSEKKADGVIISGDIAYAGKQEEYKHAGDWLDRLTAAAGCDREAVQLVPGNHDIDRSRISLSAQHMINEIILGGDKALDKYLASERDREILYDRFSGYRVFAEGYDCPLDNDGNVLHPKLVEIADGKFISFHGINTALICSNNKDEEGKLLLGQRQRVIPRITSTETIIVAHHPLNWIQDSEDAKKYIENRARIFVSGHEHKPDLKIAKSKHEKDLLLISSGAAVPPEASEEFNYCYNILVFSFDETKQKLIVKVFPRTWSDDLKEFCADLKACGKDCCEYELECPNFSKPAFQDNVKFTSESSGTGQQQPKKHTSEVNPTHIVMPDKQDQVILLRFFRDLSSSQRLELLVKMDALPSNLKDVINHTLETALLRKLLADGKAEQINDTINIIIGPKI